MAVAETTTKAIAIAAAITWSAAVTTTTGETGMTKDKVGALRRRVTAWKEVTMTAVKATGAETTTIAAGLTSTIETTEITTTEITEVETTDAPTITEVAHPPASVVITRKTSNSSQQVNLATSVKKTRG